MFINIEGIAVGVSIINVNSSYTGLGDTVIFSSYQTGGVTPQPVNNDTELVSM
ncbi:MAG: hypothetical protein WDO19_06550 [Bacteroidota bacterium]